jgi:hypothetical protein
MQTITRTEAQEQGLKHYFTGKPCRRGHIAPRDKSRECIECVREKNQRKHVNMSPQQRSAKAAYLKGYRKRPEVKARLTAYFSSESIKDYKKTYFTRTQVKVAHRMRQRVRDALAWSKGARSWGAIWEIIGCTREQLLDHISGQFQTGMTWENMGDWHIDHIRPCASFDLTDPKQQRQCFHFSNLQPLWAADNLAKSDKWEAA